MPSLRNNNAPFAPLAVQLPPYCSVTEKLLLEAVAAAAYSVAACTTTPVLSSVCFSAAGMASKEPKDPTIAGQYESIVILRIHFPLSVLFLFPPLVDWVHMTKTVDSINEEANKLADLQRQLLQINAQVTFLGRRSFFFFFLIT
jgi:hypothetical protein